jgi:predicted ATPase
MLKNLTINNFRSVKQIRLATDKLTVLFGPNGAGKSTILEAIWLARTCAIAGTSIALSGKHYGISTKWDGAKPEEPISIGIETPKAVYQIQLDYQEHSTTPSVTEKLIEKHPNNHEPMVQIKQFLHRVRYYQTRYANFSFLRQPSPQTTDETPLSETGNNLWSVLYQLFDKQSIYNKYNTIIKFMQESFPSFQRLQFEANTPGYAHFIEKGRHKPIEACHIADGQLQILMQLTALFSEDSPHNQLILLDEPESSLHPWALSVLADAVETATQDWHKQVLMATQSPVLISQFKHQYIFTTEIDETGKTVITQVSEIKDIQELLDDYAAGSLYMAESIAPQSKRLEIPAEYETEGI